MASQRWTEEDIERAKDMRNQGVPYKEIGKSFDRSTKAIKELFARYRDPNHMKRARDKAELLDARKDIMIRLVQEGKTRNQISESMGLKPKHAAWLLSKFGLNPTRHKGWWTQDKIEILNNLMAQGYSNPRIAKAMGITRGRLAGYLFRSKITTEYNEGIKLRAIQRSVRDRQVRALVAAGHNRQQVASALNISLATVDYVFRKLNLPRVRVRRRTAPLSPSIRTKPHEGTAYVTDPRDLEIPTYQRKSQAELDFYTCRFPVGDPDKPDFFFCGAIPQKGSSYCTHHHNRCYQSEYAMAEAA